MVKGRKHKDKKEKMESKPWVSIPYFGTSIMYATVQKLPATKMSENSVLTIWK